MPPELDRRYDIRVATAADAARLSDLGRRTFVAAFGAANTPEDMDRYLRATYSVDLQRGELTDPAVRVLFAVDRDRIAGYVMLRRGRRGDGVVGSNPLEIQRLYADLPWLGRGVGRQLLEHVADLATAQRHDSLWLAVWQHNPRAQRLYQRHGFRVVGSQTFVLGDDRQHDLVMERQLVDAGHHATIAR